MRSQDIHFQYVSGEDQLDSLVDIYGSENKLFLLNFSSSECEPCQDVENNTYTDEEVISFLNRNFILIRIDVDDRNNYPLIAKYQVDRIPFFVFLNTIGNPLGSEAGNLPAEDMLELCDRYYSIFQQLFDIKAAYLANTKDPLTLAAYALILEELAYYDKGFEIAEEYHGLSDTLQYTEEEWQILYIYGPAASIEKARQLIANVKVFEERYNSEELNLFLIDAFQLFYDMAIKNKDQDQLKEALNIIPLVDYGEESLVPIQQMQEYFVLKYYQETADWNNYAEYAVYFLGKYMLEDTDMAEIIYNFYYYVDDEEMTKLALAWAETLMEKEENFSSLIAYAMMQYKSGDADRANKFLDKATKLAQTQDERQIIFQLSQEFNKEKE